ncbi:unnamed protein product, partial [Closterium sp. Naga37s-1]
VDVQLPRCRPMSPAVVDSVYCGGEEAEEGGGGEGGEGGENEERRERMEESGGEGGPGEGMVSVGGGNPGGKRKRGQGRGGGEGGGFGSKRSCAEPAAAAGAGCDWEGEVTGQVTETFYGFHLGHTPPSPSSLFRSSPTAAAAAASVTRSDTLLPAAQAAHGTTPSPLNSAPNSSPSTPLHPSLSSSSPASSNLLAPLPRSLARQRPVASLSPNRDCFPGSFEGLGQFEGQGMQDN